jgi:hypothetical protein
MPNKKMLDVYKIASSKNINFTADNNVLMVCSPVGNQTKFNSENKAQIIISGYCTALDAAKAYLEDDGENKEIRNTFNTKTMRKYMVELIKTLGIKNSEEMFQDCINADMKIIGKILMTQTLCCITADGSSNALEVEKALKNYPNIRKQAESSLTNWYNIIDELAQENAYLLVMGEQAWNLLEHSYLNCGKVKIDFNSIKPISLLSLMKGKYNTKNIIHAAALRYPSNYHRWVESNERKQLVKELSGVI